MYMYLYVFLALNTTPIHAHVQVYAILSLENDLYLFRVILIKAANVKGISCIHLTSGWNKGRLQLSKINEKQRDDDHYLDKHTNVN